MEVAKTIKTKGAFCSDIHFGRKQNSDTHNQDCLNFLDWFCERVKEEECDYVAFLGDWNENRNSLNISTLNFSYHGAKKLNDLGLPVYFIVGNHDLYHRHNREIYSVVPFHEFTNFIVIDQPYIEHSIKDGVLFSPYLFHDEYPSLQEYTSIPFWAGHFEFQGFQVTGHSSVMEHGPDANDFKQQEHIVSGHFHKRQQSRNVTYIGNTFPMDFSDANDVERGCMIYNHKTKKMKFHDWEACPKYTKLNLSSLLDDECKIHKHSVVKCLVDVQITFEEMAVIKQTYVKLYELRDFIFEETAELKNVIAETDTDVVWEEGSLDTIDDLVVQMLGNIETEMINNTTLIKIYQDLNTQLTQK